MIRQQFKVNAISNLYAVNEASKIAYGWASLGNQITSHEHLLYQSEQQPPDSWQRALLIGAGRARRTFFTGALDVLVGSGPVGPSADALLRAPGSRAAWREYIRRVTSGLTSMPQKSSAEKEATLVQDFSAAFRDVSQMGVFGFAVAAMSCTSVLVVSAVQTAVDVGFHYAAEYMGVPPALRARFVSAFSYAGIGASLLWVSCFQLPLEIARLQSHAVGLIGLMVGACVYGRR